MDTAIQRMGNLFEAELARRRRLLNWQGREMRKIAHVGQKIIDKMTAEGSYQQENVKSAIQTLMAEAMDMDRTIYCSQLANNEPIASIKPYSDTD